MAWEFQYGLILLLVGEIRIKAFGCCYLKTKHFQSYVFMMFYKYFALKSLPEIVFIPGGTPRIFLACKRDM